MGRRLLAYALSVALILCTLPLAGCFGIPQKPAVAATVNGTEITEDTVTEYIEGFRSENEDYETDTGWAEFLRSNGMTAESLRSYLLEENFIPREVIRQECSSRNITLTDEALNEVISQEKAYYEERYGADSWSSVLASYGYDEESWRENESDRLLEERLKARVIKNVTVSKSEVQDEVDANATNYHGKHSYYAAFNSEQDAAGARAKMVSKGEKISLKRFKKMGGDVSNAGWNSLSSDRQDMSQSYIATLNGLQKNHVSDPVQVGDSWYLVYCDAMFSVSKKSGHVDQSKIPKRILAQLKSDALQDKISKKFSTWVDEREESYSIAINEMPEGLSYDVNVSLDSDSE